MIHVPPTQGLTDAPRLEKEGGGKTKTWHCVRSLFDNHTKDVYKPTNKQYRQLHGTDYVSFGETNFKYTLSVETKGKKKGLPFIQKKKSVQTKELKKKCSFAKDFSSVFKFFYVPT